MDTTDPLIKRAIKRLQTLISIPSLSKQEDKTGDFLFESLKDSGIQANRHLNNIWAVNASFDENKPTILLNSHHDTVKPNKSWVKNPFEPLVEGDKLFGLGSNDAGASLVSLLATFEHFYDKNDLAYNLVFAATAEEEISGQNGIAALLPKLPNIEVAIVGEPTEMNIAIAEKGLMVVDAYAKGKAGHAARDEGVNAIYKAMDAIQLINKFEFAAVSAVLGKTKMSVTQIDAGYQHNVVPDLCHFVIDIRTNEFHSNQFVHETLSSELGVELKPRSFRLNSSKIDTQHPLVQAGVSIGCETFGSPTLSDQALMPFNSMKMGVGKSARSHTADEFILLSEIENGIKTYIDLLSKVLL